MLAGAMCAAVKFTIAHFHSVTDDLASAVCTPWRHRVDRALKAIECTAFASLDYLKRLVIVVSTDITLSHLSSFLKQDQRCEDLPLHCTSEVLRNVLNDGKYGLLPCPVDLAYCLKISCNLNHSGLSRSTL
jgi:hypothetical protein